MSRIVISFKSWSVARNLLTESTRVYLETPLFSLWTPLAIERPIPEEDVGLPFQYSDHYLPAAVIRQLVQAETTERNLFRAIDEGYVPKQHEYDEVIAAIDAAIAGGEKHVEGKNENLVHI